MNGLKRKRRTRRAHIPDLDYLEPPALLRFYLETWEPTVTERARVRFPERPIGFLRVSEELGRYALFRYRALLDDRKTAWWSRQAEGIYADLPKWAQWRRKINVRGMTAPGQKFRKHAPRKRGWKVEANL